MPLTSSAMVAICSGVACCSDQRRRSKPHHESCRSRRSRVGKGIRHFRPTAGKSRSPGAAARSDDFWDASAWDTYVKIIGFAEVRRVTTSHPGGNFSPRGLPTAGTSRSCRCEDSGKLPGLPHVAVGWLGAQSVRPFVRRLRDRLVARLALHRRRALGSHMTAAERLESICMPAQGWRASRHHVRAGGHGSRISGLLAGRTSSGLCVVRSRSLGAVTCSPSTWTRHLRQSEPPAV